MRRASERVADCNPGTSPLTSLLLVMNMAATLFRLTVDEALAGVTREAARALGRLAAVGTLEPGKWCDLAIWDVERAAELVYRIGFKSAGAAGVEGGMSAWLDELRAHGSSPGRPRRYPAVVIPVMTQHYAMLQRNLLHTGVYYNARQETGRGGCGRRARAPVGRLCPLVSCGSPIRDRLALDRLRRQIRSLISDGKNPFP